MTINQALNWGIDKLTPLYPDSASLDAELLLCFYLKKDRAFLLANLTQKVGKLKLIKFKRLIKRRLNNWPVAYLIGHKEFFSYDFYINKNVLVPRPLTEKIVKLALQKIPELLKSKQTITIADIGCGSGAIIISLANELKKIDLLNKVKLTAVDISAGALKVAKKNAVLFGLKNKIEFKKSNLLSKLNNQKLDLILTNLPYLTLKDYQGEPSIKKEPKLALVGDFYNKLFSQVKKLPTQPLIIYEDKDGVKIA